MNVLFTSCPKCGSDEIRFRERRQDWFCDGCDHRWVVDQPSQKLTSGTGDEFPTVFLSYGRGDDEPFVERIHGELTQRGFDVWFDRVNMPSRNLTFHQEILDAISERQRLLLVVGPHAVSSDYVRQEWKFALEADKVVTPILRLDDYPIVPDELKLLHCEDFRDNDRFEFHLNNLARQLAEPPPPLGKLIAVPSLPTHYLARKDRLIALRDALRSDLERPVVITGEAARVGIHGMGGIGKSVLASALAHDRLIREAFPDGIVWVPIGSQPDIPQRQREVHRALGGDGRFQTASEGRMQLTELLADKSVLLIIDDVWQRSDADDFDVLGPRCRALVTTRDAGMLTSLGGTHHVVVLLTDAEALHLLGMAVGLSADALPAEARDIVHECGRLPLAIALCGGMLQAGTPWTDVLAALREHELEFLSDEHAAEPQHCSMLRAIEVSVSALDEHHRERLVELSVFPPDEQIPEAAVLTLWQHTGGLSPRQARRLLVQLHQRSLLQINRRSHKSTDQVGQISLHDLIHDYASRSAQRKYGTAVALTHQLLDAYRSVCTDGWHSGPNDGYFYQHLCYHFINSEEWDELEAVFTDLEFLEAKVAAGLVFDLVLDFKTSFAALPTSRPHRYLLRLLEEGVQRDIQFIARHADDYPQGLFQSLWNACWWYDCPEADTHYGTSQNLAESLSRESDEPKLYRLLQEWKQQREHRFPGFRWLRSLRPPAMPLGTPQVLLLKAKGNPTCVKFSPDGKRIVCVGLEGELGVWDASNGSEVFSCERRSDVIEQIESSEDGKRLVILDRCGTIREIDLESGAEMQLHRGPVAQASSIDFSVRGDRCAFGFRDGRIKLHDFSTGDDVTFCRGDGNSVRATVFSTDGNRLMSGFQDGSISMWSISNEIELLWEQKHDNSVECLAFSPKGNFVASSAGDATVRVWSPFDGTELSHLKLEKSGVWTLAFSIDGNHLAGGFWNDVHIWKAETLDEVVVLQGHEKFVECVSFSPDGNWIASGASDGTLRLWDLESGQQRFCWLGHVTCINSIAFSGDGSFIAAESSDHTVRVWQVTDGKEIRCFKREVFEGSRRLVFTLDAEHLRIGSLDGSVCDWNIADGVEQFSLWEHRSSVQCVAYSPDAELIATGGRDTTICLWNSTDNSLRVTLRGHTKRIACLAFSPDGTRLASGSWENGVRIWDTSNGNEIACLKGDSFVNAIVYSADGTRMASGTQNGNIRVWDTTTGNELICLWAHTKAVPALSFSGDGKLLVTGSHDKTVRVWDLLTQSEVACFKGHTSIVQAVAFSPDSKHVISGSWDRTARVWQIQQPSVSKQPPHLKEEVYSTLVTSPDGQRLASSALDHSVVAWDSGGAKVHARFEGHRLAVKSIAFSRDASQIVSGSADRTVRVWNLSNEDKRFCLEGHKDHVTCVTFFPNEQRVLSGSLDHTIRIWDLSSGTSLASLHGHLASVRCIAVSPDGSLIASGSDDKTARLWNAETAEQICCIQTSGRIEGLAFSPDGTNLAVLTLHKIYFVNVEGSATIMRCNVTASRNLGHLGCFSALAYSPDGNQIVMAYSMATEIKRLVWNVRSGECVKTIDGCFDIEDFAQRYPPSEFGYATDKESVFEDKDGTPLAFLSEPIRQLRRVSSNRTWAGRVNDYVAFIRMEGAE